MRLHFFTNGIFSTSIAGGDIHFLKLAEGAARAGYELNFFGGHALQEVIRKHNIPGTVTLTDDAMMPKTNTGALGGQVKLFRDMYTRRIDVNQFLVMNMRSFVFLFQNTIRNYNFPIE